MKCIKKMGLFICFIMSFVGVSFVYGIAGGKEKNPVSSTENIDQLDGQGKTIAQGSTYIGGESGWLKGILTPKEPSDYDTSLGYAMQLIQITINWLLGMLAFVALIYMLYCGYLIFSSGADEGSAKKGKAGIKTSAIALAGIGLSWLIISAMIWFVQNLAEKGN